MTCSGVCLVRFIVTVLARPSSRAHRTLTSTGPNHRGHAKTGGGLSSDETRAALRELLRTHRPTRFPTLAWLERHGPAGLAAAVTRTGGGAHWASMLNIPPAAPARWTDERIEAELRRICHNVERWPTRDEFREAGAQGLLRAVYSGHGSRWWAERLGLSTHGLRTRRR